jgi:hypothetical protein
MAPQIGRRRLGARFRIGFFRAHKRVDGSFPGEDGDPPPALILYQ